jgi:hypothetical protein
VIELLVSFIKAGRTAFTSMRFTELMEELRTGLHAPERDKPSVYNPATGETTKAKDDVRCPEILSPRRLLAVRDSLQKAITSQLRRWTKGPPNMTKASQHQRLKFYNRLRREVRRWFTAIDDMVGDAERLAAPQARVRALTMAWRYANWTLRGWTKYGLFISCRNETFLRKVISGEDPPRPKSKPLKDDRGVKYANGMLSHQEKLPAHTPAAKKKAAAGGATGGTAPRSLFAAWRNRCVRCGGTGHTQADKQSCKLGKPRSQWGADKDRLTKLERRIKAERKTIADKYSAWQSRQQGGV